MTSLVTGFAATRWATPMLRWWSTHRTVGLVAVYATLAVLLAVPVLVAQTPLGGDDLNHLARIYVRAHIGSDPDLARIFEVKSDLIPYLGMDLLLTPLARVLPIMLVGRIYILALVWGLVGTVVVLQRVFTGRIDLAPAAAGLVAYNGLLAWGLLNYVLGLILALLAFAAWHAQRKRPWLIRLVLFTGAATAIYLTHLLAFVLYGVLVVSYELLGRRQPWRTPLTDWVVLAGQAAPGLLLWLANHKMLTPAYLIDYGPFKDMLFSKVLILEFPFLFRGASGGSVGGVDTGLLSAAIFGMALYAGVRQAWLTCPRTLAGPLLALAVLTLLLPERAFGVALIDGRFPVAAVCLFLAGLTLTPAAPSRLALPIAAIVGLLMAAHIADVTLLMHRCDGQYAEVRRAMAMLPRGAELTTVLEEKTPNRAMALASTNLSIYQQMPQLVTIDRSGYEPRFYALTTSVGVRGGRESDVEPVNADKFTTAPKSGYVLWIHLGHRRPVPPHLMLLWRGSFFDLWQVTR